MSDTELPLPSGNVDQTAFERATRVMGAFMAAYEVFRHRIITQVRTLFAEGTTDEGPLVSGEYWKIVAPGTNELRACLNWLRDLEAISAEKMRTFDRLRGYRGQIATLFFDQISTEHIDTYLNGVQEIDDLLSGIEAWWAIRVRSDADEDSPSKRAHTAEHMQRAILTIKMLKRVARDDPEDAWRLYQHYITFKEIDSDTLH